MDRHGEALMRDFKNGTLAVAVEILASSTEDAVMASVLFEAASKLRWAADAIERGDHRAPDADREMG